jgi:hypothetical protein
MTMITGNGIHLAQMLVVRSAVKLEAFGMKASRNINATQAWGKHFGINTRKANGRQALLARLDEEIEKAQAAVQPGDFT